MGGKTKHLATATGILGAALLATPSLGQDNAPAEASATAFGSAFWPIAALLLAAVVGYLSWRAGRAASRRAHDDCDRSATLLDALGDAVLEITPGGRIDYLNPAAASLLGLEPDTRPEQADGQWRFIDHDSRAPLLVPLLAQAARDGLARLPASARLINRHGIELEVEGTCRPIPRPDDETGYLLQMRDVTEEREWRRQQPDLWDRDPVSTLPGRNYMENRLKRALANKRAGYLPMTFLDIRIEGIRRVYDQTGDLAGDSLVRHLTTLLRAHVRDTDIVARMDDEAFAVLLTACPAEVGERIAGEIRAALAAFRFEWAGREHPVRAAQGQVRVPPFEGCLDELLAAARPANG